MEEVKEVLDPVRTLLVQEATESSVLVRFVLGVFLCGIQYVCLCFVGQ